MTKKMTLHAVTLAALLSASSMAMASTPPQGPGVVTLTNTVGTTWTASIGNTPAIGDFTDVFTLMPGAALGSVAWGSVINTSFTGMSSVTFISADLNGTALLTPPPVTLWGQTWTAATLLHTPVSGPLTLTIHGSSAGGSYGGDINVSMPVPEPETYGMMIAGLGILGMLARRRKHDA